MERVSLPVGAGGGAGGGVSFSQQAETPSVAAVKAAKTKYLTKFIVLKPDFHLTPEEPALVGVAVVRWVTSTCTSAFQIVAPDRVGCEETYLRPGEETALGLDGGGNGEDS